MNQPFIIIFSPQEAVDSAICNIFCIPRKLFKSAIHNQFAGYI